MVISHRWKSFDERSHATFLIDLQNAATFELAAFSDVEVLVGVIDTVPGPILATDCNGYQRPVAVHTQ
jgi:hypothetical protein